MHQCRFRPATALFLPGLGKKITVFLAAITLTALSTATASAGFVVTGSYNSATGIATGSGTDSAGRTVSAQVQFVLTGGLGNQTLTITLTNTTTTIFNGVAHVAHPDDVLTAVFFSIAGNPSATPSSATASTVIQDPTPANNGTNKNVGGEWQYLGGTTSPAGAPGDANQGIGSAGLGIFSDVNFGGPNLQGPLAVNGGQYGIIGSTYVSGTGNGGVVNDGLIQDRATFVLTGLRFLDLSSISNVSFVFGTNLGEPETVVMPEPATIALAVSSLPFGLLALRRRFRRQTVAA